MMAENNLVNHLSVSTLQNVPYSSDLMMAENNLVNHLSVSTLQNVPYSSDLLCHICFSWKNERFQRTAHVKELLSWWKMTVAPYNNAKTYSYRGKNEHNSNIWLSELESSLTFIKETKCLGHWVLKSVALCIRIHLVEATVYLFIFNLKMLSVTQIIYHQITGWWWKMNR
jgi:hypothetical protein